MALQVQGINKILKKLSNLEGIEVKAEVEEVAKSMQNKIRAEASKFSKEQYKCIAACEARVYKGANCFIDVGLKNDEVPFEKWKGLYFQNFGYSNMGRGGKFKGRMNTSHILWFDNAVKVAAKEIQNELKKKLKEKVNKALEG